MQQILSHLLIIIAGIISGSLISWLIMKDNIASKDKHINTLTASVSERDADIRNLREKIDEQNEDIERINERFKTEFKLLAKEILDEKNKISEENGDFKSK